MAARAPVVSRSASSALTEKARAGSPERMIFATRVSRGTTPAAFSAARSTVSPSSRRSSERRTSA